jgi:hypothetical protein
MQGRKIFDRLNLVNAEPDQAVEIAQRTLSAICHATGQACRYTTARNCT